MRACAHCGVEFTITSYTYAWQRFCSNRCRQADYRARRRAEGVTSRPPRNVAAAT